jgi:hypothetical protein
MPRKDGLIPGGIGLPFNTFSGADQRLIAPTIGGSDRRAEQAVGFREKFVFE